MPLQSVPVQVLPGPLVNPGTGAISLAQLGNDALGARSETMHGVFNLLGTVSVAYE
ncbi:hypothetical protein AB4Z46_33855 [Variovorax sp. M-6]|uniref:hypothetical protein n=1 Tax=Variovorax sp. M-6 TaxID=3233041 RepID=UPI003F99B23E